MHQSPRTTRISLAFTLVELLVVVAVIGVLIAMLLPALGKAKIEAQLVKCAANQKQIALGAVGYAVDNRSSFAPTIGKDIINTYYGGWTSPTSLQKNSNSVDPVTLAYSGGGKMYKSMGSYLPNVTIFFCPLDAPKLPSSQADYIASNVGNQSGSYSLMWNWNGVSPNGANPAFTGKVKIEDNNPGLLTVDYIQFWTGASWYPTTFWSASHPYDGGVPTAPAGWGSYILGMGMNSTLPANFLSCNASYADGRVTRFSVKDTTYVNMGPVPQVQLYLPAVQN